MSKNVIGTIVVVAVALVVGLVALQLMNGDDSPDASQFAESASEVATALEGLPQNGATLGDPDAPVTIVEFIDYKCPVCAAAAEELVPEIIDTYVRPGDAKLELRPILLGAEVGEGSSILGADSEIAALGGLAAAEQDLIWNYTEVLLANQGDEQDEWVTRDLVTDAAAAVGADMDQWNATYDGTEVVDELFANNDAAQAVGYRGTPHYQVTGPGGSESAEYNGTLDPITAAIEQVSGE